MTSPDIPTPETDAAHKHYRYRSRVTGLVYENHEAVGDCDVLICVSADFARDLERRLAAATARAEEAERMIVQSQIDCLKFRTGSEAHYEALVRARLQLDLSEKNNQYLGTELERLRKEVERLRECEADTKRLNKVEFLRAKIECYAGSGVGVFVGQADYYGKTVRQAIDEIPDAPKQEEAEA